jgi:hypothetical protein
VTVRTLDKDEWRPYFDRIARALLGKRAAIEILSPHLSEEIAEQWLPLLGISYDPKSHVLEIAVEPLRHLIAKPQHLVVEENAGELATLEVVDQHGLSHIVRLRDGPRRRNSLAAG